MALAVPQVAVVLLGMPWPAIHGRPDRRQGGQVVPFVCPVMAAAPRAAVALGVAAVAAAAVAAVAAAVAQPVP
jgi:hypothetical protein